jgi:hypothetical protein
MHNKTDKDLDYKVILEKLSALSLDQFMDLGMGGLSYIKPAGNINGKPIYALHGADGSHIATGQDIPTLHVIASQNNLIPMSIQ